MKPHLSLAITFLFSTSAALAQLINPAPYIAGAQSDINYLAQGYLAPVGKSLIQGVNSGWDLTPAPPEAFSFQLSVNPTLVVIPSDDQSFLIENNKLEEIELANDASDNASAPSPTAFGSQDNGPLLRVKEFPSQTFNAPSGVGLNFLPLASLNASLGLPSRTAFQVRYLPRLSFSVGERQEMRVTNFGLGISQELTQLIPGLNESNFELSVFAAYSRLNFAMDLPDGENATDKNRELVIKTNGFVFRGIASFDLGFFTPYLALGTNSGQSNINVNGTYSYNSGLPIGGTQTVEDPVSVETKGAGTLSGNVGFRLEFLKVMAFTADYSISGYQSLSAGLGLNLEFD